MRNWKTILVSVALIILLAVGQVQAGATFSRATVWGSAQTLTAAALNGEFDNILNNLTPAGVDDESTNLAAMQATTAPYPSGTPSLATSLQGEIQRLRYAIAEIKGSQYWYEPPPVGVFQMYFGATAPTGWLLMDGKTIGDASSGGTALASASASALFTKLWTEGDNTVLPIQDSSGALTTRGVSAAADFAAHKRLPLPNFSGCAPIGAGQATPPAWVANTAYTAGQYVKATASYNYVYECTTTGTSHASTEPTWPTTVGNTVSDGTVTWTCRAKWSNRTLGVLVGEEKHTQKAAEIATHNHEITDTGHTHTQASYLIGGSIGSGEGIVQSAGGGATAFGLSTNTTGVTINNAGSSTAMNIMPPSLPVNFIIKY